ncbi:hypothetical protein [Trueperella sp. LYQ141]|uniref:hypothetical protein n=1 Tax=Trueperella sp. LYQ141 TaxID=3391058 RepID=UPI003983054A
MMVIPGPADVVAGVVAFLRARGFPASTQNMLDPAPGAVKVTRTGGAMDGKQDKAQILVEVWHTDQGACFDYARRIWAEFAAVSRDDQEAFPGLTVYEAVPSIPLQYPDPRMPSLDRHQFTVSMLVRWEEVKVGGG